ncbi:MAG TPA: LysM domain-containing protein, partial [Candidatus Tenderia electrophaga]|nr:LysM domain-containing protein [Candidatus Tenderia electrophaga]
MKSIFKPAALFYSMTLGLSCLGMTLPAQAGVSVYIVAPGDTLWSIAKENLKNPQDWKKLMKFNNMTDQNQLQVDQALRIPSELMIDFSAMPAASVEPANLPPVATNPAQDNKRMVTPVREGAEAVEDLAAVPSSAITVAATYGQVVQVNGDKRSKLKINQILTEKTRVQTGDKSGINIVLGDGSVVV